MTLLAGMLWGALSVYLPDPAKAQMHLTQAEVEALQNRVQLILRGSQARQAQVADVMGLGDILRTAAASRAQLRFNDGSLARIGERATFRFAPNTRNFQLSNGTILLLIPPGRGRSNVSTPNAAAGIQGSALFVRYIPETDTTIIGALTNNPAGPMVAFNQDGSQQQPLNAGEMVVVEQGQITHFYEFDLKTFYDTSPLVEDLDLTDIDSIAAEDAIAAVRGEIIDALSSQETLTGNDVIETPAFVRLPSHSPTSLHLSLDEEKAIETSFTPLAFSLDAPLAPPTFAPSTQLDNLLNPLTLSSLDTYSRTDPAVLQITRTALVNPTHLSPPILLTRPPHSPSTSAAPTATVRPIPQAVKPNEPVPPPSTVTNPTTPNPAHIHCDAYEACAPNLTPPR